MKKLQNKGALLLVEVSYHSVDVVAVAAAAAVVNDVIEEKELSV